VSTHSEHHELKDSQFRVADADDELPHFAGMLPAHRNRAFDQSRQIGSFGH
jgi:hypothetical protein